MFRNSLRILFASLALLVPAAVSAVDYGGISAAPAYPDATDERTASWFLYTLTPGEQKDDALRVVNDTSVTKTLELYGADATASTGGGSALKRRSEGMREVGAWVTLKQNEITLEAGQDAVVAFALAVPAGVASGEYDGGIMVQEQTAAPIAAGSIDYSVRMGVRIYVTVAGGQASVKSEAEVRPQAAAAPFVAAAPYAASAAAIAFAGILLNEMYPAPTAGTPKKRAVHKRAIRRKARR